MSKGSDEKVKRMETSAVTGQGFPGRNRALIVCVATIALAALLYALKSAGATHYELFATPFLVATFLVALCMVIRWREWRALPVSLLAMVVLGHFAILMAVRCKWLADSHGSEVLGDILRWGAFPLALAAVAYLWRIFQNDARYHNMQDTVRDKEREYRYIIEEASYAVLVCDINGDVRVANPAAATLLLRSQKELERSNYFDVVSKEAAEFVKKSLNTHLEQHTAAFFEEFPHPGPNGRTRWLLQSVHTIIERGIPKRFQIILRDVTQQRRVQEALRQSEARLQMVFEAMSEGVVQTQPNGRILFANLSALHMLGVSRERLRAGMSFDGRWSFLRQDETPMPAEEWPGTLAAANQKPVQDVVAGLCQSDGDVQWLSISAAPVMDADRVESIVLTLRDISEKKQAERMLSLLESALDSTLEQVFLLGARGQIIYANKQAMASLGYKAADLYTKTVFDIDTQLCEADWTETWFRARSGERPTLESQHRRKDGSTFPIAMSASHIRHGKEGCLFAFVRDVSHETELASQLLRSQKMEAIGTLAGGIAHDFNNILTAIVGYTELAMHGLPADTPRHSYLGQVKSAADRATDMVRQILTFSRRREDERHPVILAPVVKESVKLLRGSLPPVFEIRTKIAASEHMVTADPGQIQQVVMNLCTNAYHAIQETHGGALTVTLVETEVSPEEAAKHVDLHEGLYARLSVSDTGCGMDEETQRRMFEPFFTTKKEGEGTGLGLTTVHRIVKNHHGAILASSALDEGTRFDVFLPAGEEIGGHWKEDSGEEDDPTGRERVLLVDDEPQVADSLRLGLGRLGYAVEWQTCGIDALEFFCEAPDRFDIIVTDQMMPGVTGLTFAADVHRIRPDVPIIIYTGYAESVSSEQARSAGVMKMLRKPLTAKQLALAIRQVLRQNIGRDQVNP